MFPQLPESKDVNLSLWARGVLVDSPHAWARHRGNTFNESFIAVPERTDRWGAMFPGGQRDASIIGFPGPSC